MKLIFNFMASAALAAAVVAGAACAAAGEPSGSPTVRAVAGRIGAGSAVTDPAAGLAGAPLGSSDADSGFPRPLTHDRDDEELIETAGRGVHLLEYIAVDYAGAVSEGRIVNEVEYAEQLAFVEAIDAQLTTLRVAPHDPMRDGVVGLRAAIAARADAASVAERARALAGELRFRFNVQAQPPRTPSLENGGKLYAQACATCHGATGEGDGPRAHDLDPKPASFRARDRMLALPPSALFATITYGIEGTAMAAFGEAFDVAQRYDLTFFVGSLAFDDAEVARGAALTGADPDALGLRIAGLRELASQPATSLAAGGGDGLALVAYARRHPEAFENSGLALRVARERLEQSWAAYERGDAKRAAELAISAYLDGFEPVEPRIDVVRADLRARVEEDFLRYREALLGVEQRRIVAERRERLLADIAEAERALAESRFGPNAAFVAALTVLAREGFEAVLVVVALCGLLIRAGRRDALRYVHAGWIAAVVAGSATWLAARFLLDISGAEREVVEGVSSLLAACILFYVSYWLIAKVSSQRWQAFLQTRIQTALGSGSLWTLVTIAFVAVYRELFESILFFEAIAAQAGPAGLHAVFMGAAAGAVLLTALALGAFRYGLRMPVRRFFVVSSALLYALAIVLAGQGVAALQEAGLVATSRVPFVRVDWLGIHPTAETLGAQGLLVAAALLAVGWTLLRLSSGPGAATPDAAKAADCSSPRA